MNESSMPVGEVLHVHARLNADRGGEVAVVEAARKRGELGAGEVTELIYIVFVARILFWGDFVVIGFNLGFLFLLVLVFTCLTSSNI